jgi:NAD+ synthase
MTTHLHVTLAQMNPIVGDIVYNTDRVLGVWRKADKNSDLVIFPELVISGYPPEDLVLKPVFLEKVKEAVEKIAKASAGFKSAALIPCPWVIKGKTYNAVHLIENGKITATRTKHHLPNYGVFDEQRVFAAGEMPEPIPFHDLKLGVMICEDMWFPDVAAHLKKKKADILIVPNGSPFASGKDDIRIEHAKARVKETGLPLVFVNQVGGQDELVFDGGSFVLNESGDFILRGKVFVDETYTAALHKNAGGQWLAAAGHIEPELDDTALIYEALVTGLRDYITKNGFPGVLLGISGGIDSALAAAIAVDALGPELVRGVMMPSRFTSKESKEEAITLTKNLGIHLDEISIEEPVTAFHEILKTHFTSETPQTTFENIQPRSRGMILMALSNASGFMVLSTGNKSEMAVGYATLYGDMCGGFNPLKDLYKMQVYALSKWRNEHVSAGGFGPSGKIIPERTITRAPTAELKPNQTDQDTLPPYEKLDDILICMIEQEMSVQEIADRGHDWQTVARVWKMLDRAEYKRRQAPPGIKITARAFGRDRRYPITNHFVNVIKDS